jgi:hypothetical protein
LKQVAKKITLDIVSVPANHSSVTIAHFSNEDTMYTVPPNNVPGYWIRPQQLLSATAGAHRFVWDLHYQPLNLPPTYPIGATFMNTAPNPTSPWVMPGRYELRLMVDGKTFTQPLVVKMDPRVKTPVKDLQTQHDLSLQAYEARKQIASALSAVESARQSVQQIMKRDKAETPNWMKLDEKLALLQSSPRGNADPGLRQLDASFAGLHDLMQDSDWPPTMQMTEGLKSAQLQLKKVLKQWEELKKAISSKQ